VGCKTEIGECTDRKLRRGRASAEEQRKVQSWRISAQTGGPLPHTKGGGQKNTKKGIWGKKRKNGEKHNSLRARRGEERRNARQLKIQSRSDGVTSARLTTGGFGAFPNMILG